MECVTRSRDFDSKRLRCAQWQSCLICRRTSVLRIVGSSARPARRAFFSCAGDRPPPPGGQFVALVASRFQREIGIAVEGDLLGLAFVAITVHPRLHSARKRGEREAAAIANEVARRTRLKGFDLFICDSHIHTLETHRLYAVRWNVSDVTGTE